MPLDYNDIIEQRKKGFTGETSLINTKIASIVNDLESIDNSMKDYYPRVSENYFINYYLLAFAGRGESVEDNYLAYLKWLTEVAKNYNVPVHVCDNNDPKKILFTVPGISNTATINPTKSSTREVNNAITMANEAMFMQPVNWQAILENNLNNVLRKVYDKNNVISKEQEVWFSIFKRYEKYLKDKPYANPQMKKMIEVKNEEQSSKQNNQAQANYAETDDPI